MDDSTGQKLVSPYTITKTRVEVNLVGSDKFKIGSSKVINPEVGTASATNTDLHLIELARQIQKADDFVKANASNKLSVIAKQIRFLQEQAREILADAKRDEDLHHASCNFKKIPGTIYFLYRRRDGKTYFSLVAPKEWGTACPHEFLGAYRLEFDQSWTPVDNIPVKNAELALMENILRVNQEGTHSPKAISSDSDQLLKNLAQQDEGETVQPDYEVLLAD